MTNCCENMVWCFSKVFLFVLNFIVFVVGIAVIVVASLILSEGQQFQALLEDGTFSIAVSLLVLGIIVMIVGFFGCFGAIKESPCLLYTYAGIVLVLLVAQISVSIYLFVNKDKLMDIVGDNMVKLFGKIGGNDTELTHNLDLAQNALGCCGVYNYTDWVTGVIETNVTSLLDGGVPDGCCLDMESTICQQGHWANYSPENVSYIIYTTGCYTAFVDIIGLLTLWLAAGAVVLGLLQLLCVLIACGIGQNRAKSGAV